MTESSLTESGLTPGAEPFPPLSPRVRTIVTAFTCLVVAVVAAYLATTGQVVVAVGLLVAVPVAALAVRSPMAALCIWLLTAPFVVETFGGGMRMAFYLVHRILPLAAVVNVLFAVAIGARSRLPKLTWAEVAMAGYVAITAASIMYTSSSVTQSALNLYDRVFAPMCLYLLVRFVEPDENQVRKLLPVVVFVVLTQTVIGALQWIAPGALPGGWDYRIGLRTVGSLRQASVYGTTMLFAALLLLHFGKSLRNRLAGRLSLWLIPVTIAMVFLTYSRSSWLAGVIVLIGALFVHPRYVTRLVLVVATLAAVLVMSGAIQGQIEYAQARFLSEDSTRSALSRLPVMAASARMLERKPLTGWGYGRFDDFDREFQGSVAGLVVPEQDHASHNLYLTLLAEQGLPGFALFMGPFFYWLVRSRAVWGTMPREGIMSRKLLVLLWLTLSTHIVANMWANMRSEWGLGLWWLTLGMIGSLVARYHPLQVAERARRAEEVSWIGTADATVRR